MGKCSCSGFNNDCFKCGGTGFTSNNYHIDTSRLPPKNKAQKVIDRISNRPVITITEVIDSPSKYFREVYIEKFIELNEQIKNLKKNVNQIEKPNNEIIRELKLQFDKIQIILSKKLHKPTPNTQFAIPNVIIGSASHKKKNNNKKKHNVKEKTSKSLNSDLIEKKSSKIDTQKPISRNATIGDLINLGMVKQLKKSK